MNIIYLGLNSFGTIQNYTPLKLGAADMITFGALEPYKITHLSNYDNGQRTISYALEPYKITHLSNDYGFLCIKNAALEPYKITHLSNTSVCTK